MTQSLFGLLCGLQHVLASRGESCLLSNAPDSGLNHGLVPSGLQWTWGTGRSTAETGSDALPAAEDIGG